MNHAASGSSSAVPAAPASIGRVWELLKPYRGQLAYVLFLLFALTGLNMVMPLFIKLLIDDVFPANNWALLWAILFGIVGIYILRNFLYFICKYTMVRMGEDLSFKIRNKLFENLQRLSLHFYRHNKPGKIASRVMNDTFSIQAFMQDEVPALLQSVLMFVGLIAVIYAVDWELALVSTVLLPLHLVAAYYFKKPIKEYSKRSQEQLSVVQGNLIEKFLGVEVVKGFTAEERENHLFQRATEQSRQNQMISRKYHTTQKVVADLLIGLGTIGLLGFGAFQVMGPRQMAPGTFIAFFTYVLMLYPVVIELMSGFAKLTRVSASIDRVFELMEAEDEGTKQVSLLGLPSENTRAISFENVSFRFNPQGPLILDEINLDIPRGKICAIVGATGAGKSTLVGLVPRFLEPCSGRVLIDGHCVKGLDLHQLRKEIGIAFQESFLFNSTILENLRYARPDASLADIQEITHVTGVDEFIERMPRGYETFLGEDGVTLSQGEKQGITLTRALLKDPKILILDEATASLDSGHEMKILSGVLDFMKNKTTLIITHRLDLIHHAHIVAQLESGRLAYKGSPEAFVSSGGLSGHMGLGKDKGGSSQRGPGDPSRGVGKHTLLLALIAVLFCLAGGMGYAATEGEPKRAAGEGVTVSEEVGLFIPMINLNQVEIEELFDVVIARLQVEEGYRTLNLAELSRLPDPPESVVRIGAFSRRIGEGEQFLQLGFRSYLSQPPYAWLHGSTKNVLNPTIQSDIAGIKELLDQGMELLDHRYDNVRIGDLSTRRITLSYIDVDRCLALLKGFGFQTVEFNSSSPSVGKMSIIEPVREADLKNLPVIFSIPESEHMDLVSAVEPGRTGSLSLGMATGTATAMDGHTSASPGMEILVMYHPARPEQFSSVRDLIRSTLDVPARQILIEAMVLEISERALQELGVEWSLQQDFRYLNSLRLGRPSLSRPTLQASTHDTLFGYFQAQLEALITSGEAEVLSRPSVLTLDNRQASIRVGEDIPVASSVAGLQAGDKVSFDFQYIPVGILLNVRPRISAEGDEVTMQIDGTVSAQMIGEDLVIFDQQRQELARAPRISTRRVQTYSRVANNTPFIIGGLISRNDIYEQSKVPLLGDIPILGALFRHERRQAMKREVVIVLTPFVLEEGASIVDRRSPRDEDAFDNFDHELFRNSYRIRTADVFDLDFLSGNPELNQAQFLADRVASANHRLGGAYPFDRFTGGRIPGEDILVYRQMYNVVNRLGLDEAIDLEQIIFFQPNPAVEETFSVAFLLEYLREVTGVTGSLSPEEVLEALGDQALAMTFTLTDSTLEGFNVSQPVPDVYLVDCPDRETWSRLLWELNQPDGYGRERYTILFQNEADLSRFRSAVQVKGVVRLNSPNRVLRLSHFSTGRHLLMPDVGPDQIHLIDIDTARFFFYTQHYYPAQREELLRHMEALNEALQSPSVSPYLSNERLPSGFPGIRRRRN